jgi:hypothetical protein
MQTVTDKDEKVQKWHNLCSRVKFAQCKHILNKQTVVDGQMISRAMHDAGS